MLRAKHAQTRLQFFNPHQSEHAQYEFVIASTRNLVPRAMPVRGLGWHWLWGNGMNCV